MVLRAEATRLSKIKEAEGEAEALLAVQKALADSLRLLNEAAPSDAVLRIKALEAFSSVADGKATKIIIPSEIQGLAGLATAFKESIVAVSYTHLLVTTVFSSLCAATTWPPGHIQKE